MQPMLVETIPNEITSRNDVSINYLTIFPSLAIPISGLLAQGAIRKANRIENAGDPKKQAHGGCHNRAEQSGPQDVPK
jgi:hypothetical protein